jgi:hypothetical protein
MKSIVAVGVTLSFSSLFFWMKDVGLGIVGRSTLVNGRIGRRDLFEDMSRIEELGVDEFGGEEFAADDEDFSGDVSKEEIRCGGREKMKEGYEPGRGRLGSFDTAKELIKDPDEIVVVGAPEDLGDKGAALC